MDVMDWVDRMGFNPDPVPSILSILFILSKPSSLLSRPFRVFRGLSSGFVFLFSGV